MRLADRQVAAYQIRPAFARFSVDYFGGMADLEKRIAHGLSRSSASPPGGDGVEFKKDQ
jgi:hypothetical protein